MYRGDHRVSSRGHVGWVVLLLVVCLLILSGTPAAATDGQAGKSHVYHCSLVPSDVWDGTSWGNITLKLMGDGTYWYNATVHGLTPGQGYEMRSGGPFDPPADVVANGGGNAIFKGRVDRIGIYFNFWIEPATPGQSFNYRVLRTAPDCIPRQ